MRDREQRRRSLLLALAGTAALTMMILLCAYQAWERPPEQKAQSLRAPAPPEEAAAAEPAVSAETAKTLPARPTETPPPAEPTEDPLPAGEALSTGRQDGVYTILFVGNDDGNFNTDTLILGRIDTVRRRMDFVSIPRDTLINLPWRVRKINAVYWGSRAEGGDGITALKEQIARLTGFEPDCYAVLDLEVFEEAVDCIGGVSFDVPAAMDYEDPSQDLYIHLQPGPQLLDGNAAMGLCRFRSAYVTGDLGRIEMQQRFLRSCADQFLSLGSIPQAQRLIRLLAENLETDMSAANMAFFLRQFLACREEDIHFCIAPCTPETISGYSYAVLELDGWLETVNECLNPFDSPIGREHVDLVYRSGGGFAGTAGLRDPAYYRSSAAPASAPAPLPGEEEDAEETEAEENRPVIIVAEP